MITLYLIRHGETLLNNLGVFQGRSDFELNDKGIVQSIDLANRLENIEIDLIISSPLKRANMTASYIAINKSIDIMEVEALQEFDFGAWEGLRYQEIAKEYPKEWEEWVEDWLNYSPQNGENFKNFYLRISKEMDRILCSYSNKNIVIVSHDGVMRVIVIKLLKMRYEGFWNFHFEHGKYSVLELEGNNCLVRGINI